MKNIRLGKRRYSLVAPSENDHYFSTLGDGCDDPFDSLCDALISDPATSALDIGANLGTTAAILSQHLPQGRVYAFEPGPAIFKALQTNLASNGLDNVTPLNLAVGETPGSFRFHENSAYGHLTEDSSGTEVTATTVDDFVQKIQFASLDFIKIDVEGFEQSVLKGAAETIAKYDPIIQIEFNCWCLVAHSRVNGLDFGKWLLDNFRYVYLIDRHSYPSTLTRIQKDDAIDFVAGNMIRGGAVDDLLLTNNDQYFPILERMRAAPRGDQQNIQEASHREDQPGRSQNPSDQQPSNTGARFTSGDLIGWREILRFARRRILEHLRS